MQRSRAEAGAAIVAQPCLGAGEELALAEGGDVGLVEGEHGCVGGDDACVVARKDIGRVDCTNVLNHPWPADPIGMGTVGQPGGTISNFSANNFGQIINKGGTNNGFPRQFQAKLRFSF